MLPVDESVDTVDLDLHPNEASDLAVVPAAGSWPLRPDLRDRARRGRDRGVDRGPRPSRRRCQPRVGSAVRLSAGADRSRRAHRGRGGVRLPGRSPVRASARTSAPRTARWRRGGRGSRGSRTPTCAAAVEGTRAADRDRAQPLRPAPRDQRPAARVGVDLRELGPRARERLILRTIERGAKKSKSWVAPGARG